MKENTLCPIEEKDGIWTCPVCGFSRPYHFYRNCKPIRPKPVRRKSKVVKNARPGLPGTNLRKIIKALNYVLFWMPLGEEDDCPCKNTALWMDRIGVKGCEVKIEKILDRLVDEAKRRKLPIPFKRWFARRLVKLAILMARRTSDVKIPKPKKHTKKFELERLEKLAKAGKIFREGIINVQKTSGPKSENKVHGTRSKGSI
jgi:hypothetical protein